MIPQNPLDNSIQYFENMKGLIGPITSLKKEYQLVFLCDSNTYTHCYLPYFNKIVKQVIVVSEGDIHKNFDALASVCEQLLKFKAHKKTLLLSLGGGLVSDLGGFAASIFKRGIPYVNIPTSLLAMCDAAFGGKTAINLSAVKNAVGSFYNPLHVWVCPLFLQSLPQNEWRSAWGEIMKMLLLFYPEVWTQKQWLTDLESKQHVQSYIRLALNAKQYVVKKDPVENNLRKVLNYGHSIGHAIEAVYNDNNIPMLHGNAIIWGMQLENMVAYKLGIMNEDVYTEINKILSTVLPLPDNLLYADEMSASLLQDKKNEHNTIRMSLLSKPGSFELDVHVPMSLVENVILYNSRL